MSVDLVFDPLIPEAWLWGLSALAAGAVALGAALGARGTALRALSLGLLVFALAGPMLAREDRQSLSDVVAIVADRSQSQAIGTRTEATDGILKTLQARLDAAEGIETRIVEASSAPDLDGTHLFDGLSAALKDVPPERLGAVILATDGEVHDVPAASPFAEAPVHVLLTGERNEKDRKLTIVEAPPFGIVGERVPFTIRVDDLGTQEAQGTAAFVTLRVDGGNPFRLAIPVGVERALDYEIGHGGPNIIEIEVEPGPAELSLQNNRAVIETTGVRDRLRVLLVSGEPHAGERTWRNLLKADPSVDLVHFTILRPPDKQDATPPQELALISFPVRELFGEKLYDFDLIIFDRYRRRDVIPPQYFSYMTDYVERGGAILIAAGPDFGTPYSIASTSLVSILPSLPTSRILEQGFKPRISPEGFRHPVTANLPGANDDAAGREASWGRWFRLVESESARGKTLMTGADGQPLLVLDRIGEGRIAALMSDHVWLWARGFEGGGPQAELLRRLAHWLMKEPDLEEELLSAKIQGRTLTATRRTMDDAAPPVELTYPSGRTETLNLAEAGPGRFEATAEIDEVGLYRLNDGRLTAIAAAGPLNPLEAADMRTTDEILRPLTETTGGGIFWVGGRGRAEAIPAIRSVRPERLAAGGNWLGIRRNQAYVVESTQRTPLMMPALALALLMGALILTWRREGE